LKVAVIIPFRGSPDLLSWTLDGYAQQRLTSGATVEVRVGADGCPLPPLPQSTAVTFATRQFDRVGAAAIRNRLVAQEIPDLIIFGNADTHPDPDMVQHHIDRMATLPPGSLILGAAPWEIPPNPTVFDALIAETPMIFFFNNLTPESWHDYRHAWTLNLSIRGEDFARSPGFEPLLRPVYYEDLAFAFDLLGPDRKGVFFDPAAKVVHRHPTTLESYLNREELLGIMAPVLARLKPALFATLFPGQSLTELEAGFRQWLTMDIASHNYTLSRLTAWQDQPASILGSGPPRQRTLGTIYQMHIPLKRLAFRLGFLRGLQLMDDAQWQQRVPQALWKQHLAHPSV
jgi:hypothetical protein